MHKNIFLLTLLAVTLYSASARPGLITFTQADGTTFIGELKGDSSFNWIQSNGDVIIYNPNDKFYYKAIVDKNKGLLISDVKPTSTSVSKKSSSLKQVEQKSISSEDSLNLKYLNKKAKSIHHPQ